MYPIGMTSWWDHLKVLAVMWPVNVCDRGGDSPAVAHPLQSFTRVHVHTSIIRTHRYTGPVRRVPAWACVKSVRGVCVGVGMMILFMQVSKLRHHLATIQQLIMKSVQTRQCKWTLIKPFIVVLLHVRISSCALTTLRMEVKCCRMDG